jgi:hypothetical protein
LGQYIAFVECYFTSSVFVSRACFAAFVSRALTDRQVQALPAPSYRWLDPQQPSKRTVFGTLSNATDCAVAAKAHSVRLTDMGLLQTTPHAGFPEGFFGNFIPAEPLRLKTSPRNLHHLLQSAGNMGGLFHVWNIAVVHWIVSAERYHLSRKARAG